MAKKSSSTLLVGVLLLAVGGILLATRIMAVDAAPVWLLGLGLAFSLLGVLQRSYVELLVGTLLLGLGAGMVLGDHRVWGLPLSSWRLIALGGGLVLHYLLALLLGLSRQWWPALAGVVLVAVGAMPFLRSLTFLPPDLEAYVRTWWPAALVVVGAVLVVKALRR